MQIHVDAHIDSKDNKAADYKPNYAVFHPFACFIARKNAFLGKLVDQVDCLVQVVRD